VAGRPAVIGALWQASRLADQVAGECPLARQEVAVLDAFPKVGYGLVTFADLLVFGLERVLVVSLTSLALSFGCLNQGPIFTPHLPQMQIHAGCRGR
jgi:hypothetical protein